MEKRNKLVDVIVVGFALFAIFFGAGNLIFPPFLGLITGNRWSLAMTGFLVTDPLLPVVGVIATAMIGGRVDDLGKRISPIFSKLLGAVCILIIGPFFSVPRTASTTHDIAIHQLFPAVPLVVTSVIFFALTAFLVLNPGKVIDKIGKYLTPGLLIVLCIIIINSILSPLGPIQENTGGNVFLLGFTEGYNTMDALGSALLAGIVVSDLSKKGYNDKKEQFKMLVGVGIVALLLLAFVYGGLTYVGATVGSFNNADIAKTNLIIDIIHRMFGNTGKLALGIVVALACLTTSVGLTSVCGEFFENISGGRLKYRSIVLVAVAVSFVMSLIGTEGIIKIAVPILMIAYPIVMVLIFMSIFDSTIKYDISYTGAVIGVLPTAIITSLNSFFGIFAKQAELLNRLPLSNIGFGWFLPAFISSGIFTLVAIVKDGRFNSFNE